MKLGKKLKRPAAVTERAATHAENERKEKTKATLTVAKEYRVEKLHPEPTQNRESGPIPQPSMDPAKFPRHNLMMVPTGPPPTVKQAAKNMGLHAVLWLGNPRYALDALSVYRYLDKDGPDIKHITGRMPGHNLREIMAFGNTYIKGHKAYGVTSRDLHLMIATGLMPSDELCTLRFDLAVMLCKAHGYDPRKWNI